jgi:hypothetical protein
MNFFPVFNVILGTICILIGFKIYRPFKKEKETEIMKKFRAFYILGGFGLIGWGTVKLLGLI